jgi:alpha-1,2-mannosyltransferase
MAASTIVAVLAIMPLLPFIFLLLIRLALGGLGWSLQARARDRRAAIVSRIQRDRDGVFESRQALQEADDGWERVEKTGTAENGKPSPDEWDGVVGFFHPFW